MVAIVSDLVQFLFCLVLAPSIFFGPFECSIHLCMPTLLIWTFWLPLLFSMTLGPVKVYHYIPVQSLWLSPLLTSSTNLKKKKKLLVLLFLFFCFSIGVTAFTRYSIVRFPTF